MLHMYGKLRLFDHFVSKGSVNEVNIFISPNLYSYLCNIRFHFCQALFISGQYQLFNKYI